MAMWVTESKPFHDRDGIRGDEMNVVRVNLCTTADAISILYQNDGGPMEMVFGVNVDTAQVMAEMILDILKRWRGERQIDWRKEK